MDKLKDFLNQHRDEMDTDEPQDAVWQRIHESATTGKKVVPIRTIMFRCAAAACILAIIAFGIKWIATKGPELPKILQPVLVKATDPVLLITPEVDSTRTQLAIVPIPAQPVNHKKTIAKKQFIPAAGRQNMARVNDTKMIASLADNYNRLVAYQLDKIRATPMLAGGSDYFKDFKMQLKQMDADEAGIRKDIATNGLNDTLLEQLINVCQQKLFLLKSLQAEINQMNNRVKQQQLPADSSKVHFLNI